jgi:hypothetical protein
LPVSDVIISRTMRGVVTGKTLLRAIQCGE